MRTWLSGLAVCLVCAALCVFGAYRILVLAGRPELRLRLEPVFDMDKVRLTFRFTNPGKKTLTLAGGGLELLIAIPEGDPRKYLLQMQSGRGGGDGDKRFVLPPGGSVDVEDAYPLVKGLPPGTLYAVFISLPPATAESEAGLWRGVVHAQPLALGRQ